MLGKCFVFLLLASLVLCQNYPRIGKLEGQYHTNIFSELYLCINGDVIQGSCGEYLILNGQVSSDGKNATGNFYQAGTSNCDAGTFSFLYNDEGFSGIYTCNREKGEFEIKGTKISAFRPTDDQCNLLSTETDLTLQGKWVYDDGNSVDICFKTSTNKDAFTVHASYTTENSGSYYYPNQGFVAAYHYLGGRIVKGTWFEDFNGGAWMLFIRNTGKATLWKWTGLIGNRGATYISYVQLHEPEFHQTHILVGPSSTTNLQCDRNQNLDGFVLNNLDVVFPNHQNDFYYFLDSVISEPYHVAGQGESAALIFSENGASPLLVSFIALFLAILLC